MAQSLTSKISLKKEPTILSETNNMAELYDAELVNKFSSMKEVLRERTFFKRKSYLQQEAENKDSKEDDKNKKKA